MMSLPLGMLTTGSRKRCVSRRGTCGRRLAVGSRAWSASRCCTRRVRALYWSTRCPTTWGQTGSSGRRPPRTPTDRRCRPEHTVTLTLFTTITFRNNHFLPILLLDVHQSGVHHEGFIWTETKTVKATGHHQECVRHNKHLGLHLWSDSTGDLHFGQKTYQFLFYYVDMKDDFLYGDVVSP